MPATAPLLVALALAAASCDLDRAETLLDKVARVVGLDASAKGPGDPLDAGDLYVVPAAGGDRRRLTDRQELRSPLFVDDGHLLALQGPTLVRVELGGDLGERPTHVLDLPGAVRLAGLVAGEPNLLVVLMERDGPYFPAVVCLSDPRVVPLAEMEHAEKAAPLLNRLRAAERRYGDLLLRSEKNAKQGRDVVAITSGRRKVLTRCGADRCTQGALSPDGRRVVFVRAPAR